MLRIRIQHFRLIPIRIRIQGFDDQKLKKKITARAAINNFFGSKITIYLSLGLHKRRPSYRRSLQLSKEKEHPALQNMKFLNFFLLLWVIFALLDTDPDPNPLTGLNPDPLT